MRTYHPFRVVLPALLAILSLLTLAAAPSAAAGLTLDLTANATKAKVGDDITFTVRVENTGTEALTDVTINLNLPDALDAQSVDCPIDSETVTSCPLRTLQAGEVQEVTFVVRAGTRNRQINGDVTASATSGSLILASARLAPIKIVGSPR